MNEKINNEQEMGNNDKEKLEETSKKINIKPNETKNTNNNIDSSCNSKIKSNSVVVSVKQFVENDNDLDEVTKLFRKMIGIDKEDTTSTIVRQFSCQRCNRAWWKRVRIIKQVSKCSRCHIKYQPIPFHLEFGVAEFLCQICNHKFYHWCPKNGFSVCKKCNNICSPYKILPKSNPNTHIDTENKASNTTNGNENNTINDKNVNTNSSSCNSSTSGGVSSTSLIKTNTTLTRQRSSSFNNFQKFHCKNCHDTFINLNRSIVFRPKENNDFKFCSTCRKIPYYSERHQSSGSTLASLSSSYQNDLELRFLDDEFEHATIDSIMGMETCVEEDLIEEKDKET